MKDRTLDIAVASLLGWTNIRERMPSLDPRHPDRGHARLLPPDPILVGRPPPIMPGRASELRPIPHYSEDERAAWQLVEVARKEFDVELSYWHQVKAYVTSIRRRDDGSCVAESSNPLSAATSICEAFIALAARAAST